MTNTKMPERRVRSGGSATSVRRQRRVRLTDEGVKISDLPEATRLLAGEVFPVVQDGETRKASLEQVRELIPEGEEGASAYEVWLDEGYEGTEADFLEWLQGEDGQDGKDGEAGSNGQSAYEIWLAQGNEGSEQEFLASLQGAPGADGNDGNDGEQGENGRSAYQSWLEAGNVGSEANFLASLKGEPGEPGDAAPMVLIRPVEGEVTTPASEYDGTIFIGHGAAHQGLPIIDDGDNRSGSIAIGMGAAADVVATVVGRNARGTGNHGVSVGTEASSTTVKAVAIGYRARGEGDSGVAVGNESRAAREDSVAIGRKAYAAYASSVAIGTGSRAVDSNEVGFGYQSPSSSYPATRRLAGVSDGVKDTDAVTVKQLNAALERIAQLEQLLKNGG